MTEIFKTMKAVRNIFVVATLTLFAATAYAGTTVDGEQCAINADCVGETRNVIFFIYGTSTVQGTVCVDCSVSIPRCVQTEEFINGGLSDYLNAQM